MFILTKDLSHECPLSLMGGVAASTTDSKLLKWPVQRRIHYVDELLVEFSGELSGHIHVACIPLSTPYFREFPQCNALKEYWQKVFFSAG